VPILVKIDQEMRPYESARRQTDTHTDRLTEANRFYNLPYAIYIYSYGTDNECM